MVTVMFYCLAAAAVFSTLISTIVSGMAYATLLSLSSHTTGLAPISLGAISCVALIGLSILLHKDIRGNGQWPVWKVGVFGLTGVYLLVADVSSAGTMATNLASPSGLWIARSVFWAISFLMQGLYYGYLLVQLAQKKPDPTWPRSFSQELKTLPESPISITPPSPHYDPHSGVAGFDTRRSSLRKFPRRSNRYSGGTLCLQNSEDAKNNSFETSSSISSPEPSPTQDHMPNLFNGDTRPLLRGKDSIRSMPSLRQEPRVQQSLDNLVSPSPTASTFNLESPSQSTFNLAESREHNIHPLFRSNSPSPSPTPTPGTTVKGSPSAGQTITKNTLTRMRSARSLREQNMRTPSPLPESRPELVRQNSGAGLWLSYVRRGASQYEKRYDLNESPEEK
ncbi:uncharacterized protein N7498_002952 [Penicillium cinerascens]|uniref:Uncharacterized protein n=1 Tax=Penicillium cinerascens TaxID=70096 RepID=A0A9W9TCF6_9EURO|nr:uncharacterized protein N7498_002952 [Penicillium cinerascens]KAJ5216545.1 hypothetical protein N7498_002952 [Penicillium cinerascens]